MRIKIEIDRDDESLEIVRIYDDVKTWDGKDVGPTVTDWLRRIVAEIGRMRDE